MELYPSHWRGAEPVKQFWQRVTLSQKKYFCKIILKFMQCFTSRSRLIKSKSWRQSNGRQPRMIKINFVFRWAKKKQEKSFMSIHVFVMYMTRHYTQQNSTDIFIFNIKFINLRAITKQMLYLFYLWMLTNFEKDWRYTSTDTTATNHNPFFSLHWRIIIARIKKIKFCSNSVKHIMMKNINFQKLCGRLNSK